MIWYRARPVNPPAAQDGPRVAVFITGAYTLKHRHRHLYVCLHVSPLPLWDRHASTDSIGSRRCAYPYHVFHTPLLHPHSRPSSPFFFWLCCIQVLLISDSNTDKEAAAMDVRVGYTSDPPHVQGIAHFCEHMLFLGTGKAGEETDKHRRPCRPGEGERRRASAERGEVE